VRSTGEQHFGVMNLDEIDLTDLDRFARGFPHGIFEFLRHEAPVWFQAPTRHTPGGEGFWSLVRHADIVTAASDAQAFSSHTGGSREGGGTIIEDLPSSFAAGVLLNMMDDPRHRRFRKLVTPAVSPRALEAMEAELRARTGAILDDAARRGQCDFLRDIAAELPLQAIARLLGVPQEDRHKLIEWADATLDYDDRNLGEQSAKTQAAAMEMFAYGSDLIARKRRDPQDDILSAVVHGRIEAGAGGAQSGQAAGGDAGGRRGERYSTASGRSAGERSAGEPLSELELQMFFNLLIAAGSETTRNSIAVGLLGLIEHPDQWALLGSDRSLMGSAIEEMLRWASSTPYNRRTATRDVDIGGQTIRAGDKVVLWWASANRDEAVFADPFRFDIRRDPNPHLAFGHGAHFCLGATLARIEMRMIFEGILDRFARVELAGPVEWTRSNKHTGVRHMPVRLILK
jgi:cytochrome P450